MVDTRGVALTVAWYRTSKNQTIKNNMKRVGFWEAVLGKFCIFFKKDGGYHNNHMLSSKCTPISRKCTKFNLIYNNFFSQKQSGANDFDSFKVAREQYHIQMSHVF